MSVRSHLEERVPSELRELIDLAYNYWWTWNGGDPVFHAIDHVTWKNVGKNAVKFLLEVPEAVLQEAAKRKKIVDRVHALHQAFLKYMNSPSQLPNAPSVGYLCAEFGVHSSLPIYSGGLGVLAGDHLKEVSDLGLDFQAVGLLYHEGYFVQRLGTTGAQTEQYSVFDPHVSPLTLLKDSEGHDVLISIPVGQHELKAKAWVANVGKVKLYLLDTDIAENLPEDRNITNRLYQGDKLLRIRHELLLGIGGIKLFNAIDFHPTTYHLNEGHTAFSGLEVLGSFLKAGMSFEDAVARTRGKLVFTTHTPVPAGHDVFSDPLVIENLGRYAQDLGLSHEQLLSLGRSPTSPGGFNMTALAMQLSRTVNGVSKLNAQIMTDMFVDYFKANPHLQGIIPITNGVHLPTWIHMVMQDLYSKYLGETWKMSIDQHELWDRIDRIPDQELWDAHVQVKQAFIDYNRANVRRWVREKQLDTSLVYASGSMLNPRILTLGFARRFASYKRAPLIFSDPERLKRILTNPRYPVQLVFSGKAHPDDDYGKQFLHEITKHAQDPEFEGRIAFIQDYNMDIARYIVAGVDVWLNNPRLPREASGTSGEKAAANGVVNFSTADGWWREGYNEKNGWVIGTFDLDLSDEERDRLDAESLYDILEHKIVPLYYHTKENGCSKEWVALMKESIKTVAPYFNTKRMVKDYVTKMYTPPQ